MFALNFIARRRTAVKVAAASLTMLAAAGTATTWAAAAHADGTGIATGHVTARTFLSMRSVPSTHAREVGRLKPGAKLSIDCVLWGTKVDGNDTWYKINGKRHEWVSSRYVATSARKRELGTCGNGGYRGRTLAELSLRSGPNTSDRSRGAIRAGKSAWIMCKVSAQKVDGNRFWYYVYNQPKPSGTGYRSGWVAARYVKNTVGTPDFC